MIPKIFIVHSSDIVRKGLAGIIKSQVQAEVIEIVDADVLLEMKESAKKAVFLIEDNFLGTSGITQWIANSFLESRTIVIESQEDLAGIQKNWIHCISLFSNAAVIVQKLDEILKENFTETDEHEGDELTRREQDVLKLVALGYSNKMIAEKLFISIHTVISHRKNLTEKLGIKSISGLTVYAILNHLIDTSEINTDDLF